jgi:hypothetical protein
VSSFCPDSFGAGRVRVGFVIDGQLPSWHACLRRKTVRPLFVGWPSNTPGTLMRFGWIARHVNNEPDKQWIYELYRPWRTYQAVVFVKSMDKWCRRLASTVRRGGGCAVFDANVDYFTPATGTSYFAGMSPTPNQCEQSRAMAETCDAVIASSRHLCKKALRYNSRAVWISDNILDDLIVVKNDWRLQQGEKLPLLWSGEAVKLFELLRIENVLRNFKEHIRLRLITGDLRALSRVYEPWRGRLRSLMMDLDCEVLPFQDISTLMEEYDRGGVAISPRFLDNSYNKGHTEWKISLAMARGRVALASPQPSYYDLWERARGNGVRICREEDEWSDSLENMLVGNFHWQQEQDGACVVVRQYYATSVVAAQHQQWLATILSK